MTAQQIAGLYKVTKTARVGGEGGFDYIFADVQGRRLYTPRGGAPRPIDSRTLSSEKCIVSFPPFACIGIYS
jgi:hypothetical protein